MAALPSTPNLISFPLMERVAPRALEAILDAALDVEVFTNIFAIFKRVEMDL